MGAVANIQAKQGCVFAQNPINGFGMKLPTQFGANLVVADRPKRRIREADKGTFLIVPGSSAATSVYRGGPGHKIP